jgi:hypothetical protein
MMNLNTWGLQEMHWFRNLKLENHTRSICLEDNVMHWQFPVPYSEPTTAHPKILASVPRFCFVLFLEQQPPVGQDLVILEVSRSHTTTHQSVGLLYTSDQLVAETSTWQHTTLTTNIHSSGGIRTHDLSKRAAADLRLRRHGQWDRQVYPVHLLICPVVTDVKRMCKYCAVEFLDEITFLITSHLFYVTNLQCLQFNVNQSSKYQPSQCITTRERNERHTGQRISYLNLRE